MVQKVMKAMTAQLSKKVGILSQRVKKNASLVVRRPLRKIGGSHIPKKNIFLQRAGRYARAYRCISLSASWKIAIGPRSID
jgi:hypothetical protein